VDPEQLLVREGAGREGLLLRRLPALGASAGRQLAEAWAAMPVGAAVELLVAGRRFSGGLDSSPDRCPQRRGRAGRGSDNGEVGDHTAEGSESGLVVVELPERCKALSLVHRAAGLGALQAAEGAGGKGLAPCWPRDWISERGVDQRLGPGRAVAAG